MNKKNINIEILWIAGHAGITSNELADKCAKEAAQEAINLDFDEAQPLSFSEIKKEIQSDITDCWQRQWGRYIACHMLHLITPTISTNSVYSCSDSSVDKGINRLKAGHSNFSEHRWKMKIPDTSSPLCKCRESNGNVEHYLLFCPLHDIYRKEMISEIMASHRSAYIEVQHRTVDIQTLLGDNAHLPKIVRKDIKKLCPTSF